MDQTTNPAEVFRYLVEQAANNSSEGITISSVFQPDMPLIYVNAGFERLTGYRPQDVIGRNCRFLQGEGTDQDEVDRIRDAIRRGEECTVVILNYRRDGVPFWNRLSIAPIRDQSGALTHYVGIQSDITELKETRERLGKANVALEEFRERLTRELNQARLTQMFLLPSSLPQNDRIRFAAKFVPMEEVGGDYYDVLAIDNSRYGMLIADVSGHGIPAALLTFMTSTTFKNTAPEYHSTAVTLNQTNKKLHGKMPNDAFVTMFYVIYDSASGQITYTQAGHPAGVLVKAATGECTALSTGGTFVGPFSHHEIEFTERERMLEVGDKVILYTDAISDAIDLRYDQAGRRRLFAFISEHADLPLDRLFDKVYDYGLGLSSRERYSDDFTMVGFEVMK